jgi:hypothetical protein
MNKPRIVICIGSSCFSRGNAGNVEIAERYLEEHGLKDDVDVVENDALEFIVGPKVNDAHQDPNLPVELELRRNIIKRLAEALGKKPQKSHH